MSSTLTSKQLPSRPYSHRARWGTDSWTWEISSNLLSVLAAIAVVILLLVYDKASFPDLPYHIGINSVVAILGTVSKSALLLTIASCISQYKWLNFDLAIEKSTLQDLKLHDEASRGPWGAFMLLVGWRGLSWAKLGALVTVLSIAFDPAYQALISVEQRSQYRHDPAATVKRALDFQVPQNDNIALGIDDYFFSPDLTLAIANALFSNTSSLETNPSCPTGNCTFPVFSSLAFCSNCIDVTQYLQQTSNCTQEPLADDEYDAEDGVIPEITEVKCTYWLPLSSSGENYTFLGLNKDFDRSSFNLTWNITYWDDQRRNTYDTAPSLFVRFINSSKSLGSEAIRLSNEEVIPSSFATMALFKGSPTTDAVSTGYIDTANICAFSFCAREYNVSMESGLLRSEIISTSYSDLKSVDRGLSDENSSYAYTSSYTFTFPNNPGNDFTLFPRSKAIQERAGIAGLSVEQILFSALQGGFEGDFYLSTTRNTSNIYPLESAFLHSGLNASMNIPKTLDRVAAAMTNHLRDISNHIIIGQSGSMEIYIRVTWLWLLLPIVSIGLGTSFLVSAMIATRRRKLPVWKASELALLFHGLDFPLNNTIDTRQVSAMEEVTSAVQVRLAQDTNGTLKLRRTLD